MTKMPNYIELLQSEDYKERLLGEYIMVATKYDKLHDMYVKRVTDQLDFEPTCPIVLWKEQLYAMGKYLAILRMRMDTEKVEWRIYYAAFDEE